MPNLNDATTTDLMSAWGAIIGGGATAIAATAGVAAAVAAIRTLNASKRDSRDKARPMVGAMLETDPHPTSRTMELVVTNYGSTVAYNVEVAFDPKIEDTGTDSGDNSFVPLLLARYKKPITTMMPGVELRSMWYLPGPDDENGDMTNDEPIPDLVTATVRYSDRENFWAQNTNRYANTFTLDAALLRQNVSSTHTDDHLGLHKRTAKALETMAPAITHVAKDLGRIEDYIKPAEVRAKEEAENSRRAEIIERRRAEGVARRAQQGELTP